MSEATPGPEGKKPRPSAEAKKAAAEAARRENAAPDARVFALTCAQLALVVALAWRFYPSLLPLGATVLACFVIHHWLPFRVKEAAWIVLSCVGGAIVLGSRGGNVQGAGGDLVSAGIAVLIAVVMGLVIFAVVASPLPYWTRLLGVACIFAGVLGLAAYGRGRLPLPPRTFQVLGVVFMLNIFPYLYEARHFKERARLVDFARYFFVLPVFKLIAPIPDFQKLAQSFYKRPTRAVAPEGMRFIGLGAAQFALYALAKDHVHYATSSRAAHSPRILLTHLVFAYLLYFRTAGMINMFIGVWHLFGYDMPECYRWFVFAHSPLDYWRRTNIYFKDAMTKIIYLPVYFALRRRSDLGAKLLAILAVFAGSWFVHIWGYAWYSDLKISVWRTIFVWPQETIFWAVLGFAAVVNMLLEHRAEARGVVRATRRLPRTTTTPGLSGRLDVARHYVIDHIALPPGMHPLRGAAQIVAMQLLIAVLFSLDHSPSLRAWIDTMRWWS